NDNPLSPSLSISKTAILITIKYPEYLSTSDLDLLENNNNGSSSTSFSPNQVLGISSCPHYNANFAAYHNHFTSIPKVDERLFSFLADLLKHRIKSRNDAIVWKNRCSKLESEMKQ
ncbi:hypothetical protein OnM2_022117, partial [Erysiphe neolycopersici]